MLNVIKSICSIFIIDFIFYIVYINIKLYHKTEWTNHQNIEVKKQLFFIKQKLQNGGADHMQHYYPEGYFFSTVLYGLTWCDFLQKSSDQVLLTTGVKEINSALISLNSSKGKAVFPQQLKPEYGIFYSGWTNYLLGKKLILQKNTQDSILFEQQCEKIEKAYKTNPTIFLQSYVGLSWPCDNIVAIASLALHDKIYTPKYTTFITQYVQQLKINLDKDGLIPHKTDYNTQKVIEEAKGSSQSLLLVFLKDIDEQFAQEQFTIYKRKFLTKRFGLFGVREHKKGIHAGGDIDSGPVIWEVGGSASVVGAKTYALFNEKSIAASLRNSLEAFGMSTQSQNEKKYLFGQWIVADCFIAWVNASELENKNTIDTTWRLHFQLYSLILLFALFILLFWMNRKKWTKRQSQVE